MIKWQLVLRGAWWCDGAALHVEANFVGAIFLIFTVFCVFLILVLFLDAAACRHEGLFYLMLCLLMFCWISVESCQIISPEQHSVCFLKYYNSCFVFPFHYSASGCSRMKIGSSSLVSVFFCCRYGKLITVYYLLSGVLVFRQKMRKTTTFRYGTCLSVR